MQTLRANAVQFVTCPYCDKDSMKKINITYRNYGRDRIQVYRCTECGKYCNEDKLKEKINVNESFTTG